MSIRQHMAVDRAILHGALCLHSFVDSSIWESHYTQIVTQYLGQSTMIEHLPSTVKSQITWYVSSLAHAVRSPSRRLRTA